MSRSMTTTATIEDLHEVIFRIRACEAEIAWLREALSKAGHGALDISDLQQTLVVQEIKLELLKLRMEEIADELVSDRSHEKRITGSRSH